MQIQIAVPPLQFISWTTPTSYYCSAVLTLLFCSKRFDLHSLLDRRTRGSFYQCIILYFEPKRDRRHVEAHLYMIYIYIYDFGSWGAKRFVLQRSGVSWGGLWKRSRIWRSWEIGFLSIQETYLYIQPTHRRCHRRLRKRYIMCQYYLTVELHDGSSTSVVVIRYSLQYDVYTRMLVWVCVK